MARRSSFVLMLLCYIRNPARPRKKKKTSVAERKPNDLHLAHWILHSVLYLPPNYTKDAKRKRQRRSQLVVVVGLVVLRAAWATSTSVELGCDGICDVGQLLLLLLEVFGGGR